MMIEVLESLSAHPGIMGCLVATLDGIVVASKLGGELDEEVAAAQVSSLLMSKKHLADDCQRRYGGDFSDARSRVILRATRGKIVITHLGNAYLVVVTDGYIDLKQGLLEIQSAAQKLERLGRIHA